MKININQRSTDELLALMNQMKLKSPSHLVQLLITKAYKSIPIVEDEYEHREPTKEKQA